ncbi:unnamed protein product, partial [Ixodes pacificus]
AKTRGPVFGEPALDAPSIGVSSPKYFSYTMALSHLVPIRVSLFDIVGNSGNTLDGASKFKEDGYEGATKPETTLEAVMVDPGISHSTSQPVKPMSADRYYYHLPYGDNKPCLWVKSVWQDYRRRLCNSNMILKIKEKLEAGLADIQEMVRLEKPHTDRRLR